jgi:hypothetical protein
MASLGPRGYLIILGLLLGSLACGATKESRRAGLVARRETEFADLSQQAGMVTPSYLQASTAGAHGLQLASTDPQASGAGTPSR